MPTNCPNCENEPYETDIFCRNCGEELPDFKCADCDTEVLEDDKYCPNCGAELGETVEEIEEVSDDEDAEDEKRIGDRHFGRHGP